MLDEYLTNNYEKLNDIAYNIAGIKQKDDLLSFVIEELYKCDQIRLKEIIENNQMTFYVTRVMLNQYHSQTSRYYYKYRRFYEYHVSNIIDAVTPDKSVSTKQKKIDDEKKLEWIEEKLKDLYWFDAEVFRIYYRENFSLAEMEKATKINKNTLWKAINNVKNYLKNEQ